jgi:hypothetical protein
MENQCEVRATRKSGRDDRFYFSDEAELHFAFFADHGLVPRGFPGDAGFGFGYEIFDAA